MRVADLKERGLLFWGRVDEDENKRHQEVKRELWSLIDSVTRTRTRRKPARQNCSSSRRFFTCSFSKEVLSCCFKLGGERVSDFFLAPHSPIPLSWFSCDRDLGVVPCVISVLVSCVDSILKFVVKRSFASFSVSSTRLKFAFESRNPRRRSFLGMSGID